MFKLWEIPQAIETIAEMLVDVETGEVLNEEEARKLIDDITEERDKKVEYLTKLYKNYTAEASVLKEQEQSFAKRRKAAERKADSLKKYLGFALGGEKWKAEDSSVSISYRTNKDVVKIDNLEALPDIFFKCPHTESNVAKTELKEALKAGKVSGAHLEDTTSVIIK